eukprot:365096-Chlamydomonas_euryale.AAC.14
MAHPIVPGDSCMPHRPLKRPPSHTPLCPATAACRTVRRIARMRSLRGRSACVGQPFSRGNAPKKPQDFLGLRFGGIALEARPA